MRDQKGLFETLRESVTANTDPDALERTIWDQFGQTCAVLVLDSVGFSRTTKKKGIVYFLSILARMRETGKEIFDRHGATGLRAEADNLFAEFPTADQALDAAFELHRHLKKNRMILMPLPKVLISPCKIKTVIILT